ncbi:MAG TPA: aquaporin, partial [Candidatus Polarisedimenticolaceae bacterium]|nr:aquaporin [Candidatus Polarisedimenticolaceae bacterium]
VAGLMIAWALLGNVLAQPEIRFVATLPTGGAAAALAAEFVISFVTMLVVLVSTNGSSRGRYTGLIVGGLVAIYITFEQPLSGMSMNPARSFASALPSGAWHGFWIYVVAPLAGMLAAAEIHPRLRGASAVRCAKLNHDNDQPCIFRCGYCVHGASGADRAA